MNYLKMKNKFNYLLTGVLLGSTIFFSSCSDDNTPPAEEPEEEITRVTLTFTPAQGAAVTAVWFDNDGEEGPNPATLGAINLAVDTQYGLSINLENTLATEPEEQDIQAEILEEDDEHQFFFGWTSGVFSTPTGTGNIIPRATDGNRPNGAVDGTVTYLDFDDNQRPLGLQTNWTSAATATNGVFRVVLKHQPPLSEGEDPQKSASSDSNTGSDDIDLIFDINIK